MYDSLLTRILKNDEYDLLLRGRDVPVGFDRKTNVNLSFLESVKENDIFKNSYLDCADDILVIFGTEDEVIEKGKVIEFCENNVIEYVPVEGADHRFHNPILLEKAIKATTDFFGITH